MISDWSTVEERKSKGAMLLWRRSTTEGVFMSEVLLLLDVMRCWWWRFEALLFGRIDEDGDGLNGGIGTGAGLIGSIGKGNGLEESVGKGVNDELFMGELCLYLKVWEG